MKYYLVIKLAFVLGGETLTQGPYATEADCEKRAEYLETYVADAGFTWTCRFNDGI